MDDRPLQHLESPALPADSAIADENDVWSLYNLILRRDPETLQVIKGNIGRPLRDILLQFLGSPEFYQRVLPAVIANTAGETIYAGTRSFDRLLDWVEARLPTSPELRKRLAGAASWSEFAELLLSDPELLDQVPSLRATGVDRAVALRRLGGPPVADHDIRGALEYSNVWEVKGWCADARDLEDKLTVEIFADTELLGAAVCRDFRRDIQEKLGGDGRFGFAFAVPAAAQDFLRTERRIAIREKKTGLAVGAAAFVRNDLPRRADAIETMRKEIAQAREAIGKLEAQLAQLAAGVGYPLRAYGEYAEAFDQVTSDLADEYRAAIAGFAVQPTVSIVLTLAPADEMALVEATLSSIRAQIYAKWEVVIVADASTPTETTAALAAPSRDDPAVRLRLLAAPASIAALMREGLSHCGGEFVLFLRAGDRLAADALYHNLVAIQRPGVKVLYADEDSSAADGKGGFRRYGPRFKPALDLDYLLCDNYIGRFALFDRAMLVGIGGPRQDAPGAEALDLLLRSIEAAGPAAVANLPLVLYHQRETDATVAADVCRVVNDYLARNGLAAVAEPHADLFGASRPSATRLRWALPETCPAVSLIIPTKDHPELIGPCLASLQAFAVSYRGELEILALDNGTTDPIARALLAALTESGRIRTLSLPGPFNWSAMNNRAAKVAHGEILIFLNNDILAISKGWLEELVSQALRADVGAVGGRLLFPDDAIQHAGAILGVAGASCHEAIGEPVADGGYLGRSQLQRRVAAVTGACLATRRRVFEQLGGFDEAAFKITYNDVDFCLKAAAAGLGVVYTPFATLRHFESASRGFDNARLPSPGGDEELAALRHRWPSALQDDPHYNAHFMREARPFTYLKATKRGRRPVP